MIIENIVDDVYYVGVNDRTTTSFEGLWPLPYGVSYNSYLVKGEKIALIDTVHISQNLKFLQNIKSVIGEAPIDYLVINHMEPDHSGAISIIKSYYPEIKIIGNAKTAEMIKGFYGVSENICTVADGEELNLGGKTLKFVHTPMVHWPETMVTYLIQDSILFSGDAFGCYGALNGGIIDDNIECSVYFEEMYRYYSNIVAKYGLFVQKAISKLNGIKLDYLCSTHGPVWHRNVEKVIDIYDNLSKWNSQDGVVIAYGSMYGNTEELAETIAQELSHLGVKDIKMHNLTTADLSYVLSDICRYKGLLIGTPTYSATLFPKVQTLVDALVTREVKNKSIGFFGSFTWGPQATKAMITKMEALKVNFIDNAFDMKQGIKETDLENCKLLAKSMVDNL